MLTPLTLYKMESTFDIFAKKTLMNIKDDI